jgi:hypothetical protein
MVLSRKPVKAMRRVVKAAEAALILRTLANERKSGERRLQSLARSGGDASEGEATGAVRERSKTATRVGCFSVDCGGSKGKARSASWESKGEVKGSDQSATASSDAIG